MSRLPEQSNGNERRLGKLSLVVPVFNESDNLRELASRVEKALVPLGLGYKLIFVDDGSTDDTAAIITMLNMNDPRIAMVSLSRNFGHQAAIQAGLECATGDAVIIMDGDLQDPPEVLPHMIRLWEQGSDVVFAIRRKRKESLWKRGSYAFYYRVLRVVSDVVIPLDSGDFSLVSKSVVKVICECKERNRFIRGIRSWAGFKQTGFEYERDARYAGKAKYGLLKLWKLAIDGIFSFTFLPLRLSTYLGLTFLIVSFLYVIYAVWARLYGGNAPHGWASLIVAVLFMGSIQLIMLGIMGEYIARTYDEAKRRPLFVVDKTIGIES